MAIRTLLVANRGEIAIRIMRAADALGIATVAVHGDDDAGSLHARRADDVRRLPGKGPAAYLDVDALVAVATETGCDAVHPGYGFLSERADAARRMAAAGLTFVGPRPEVLDAFGDKAQGRALAARAGVPVLRGTEGDTSLDEAVAFLEHLGPGGAVMVKAVAGGGGRGMRLVRDRDDLPGAYQRCRSEAGSAFGVDAVYVEEWLPHARHVEVQVVGDGTGAVVHLGERECSLQRRYQKLVEVAPAPGLPSGVRDEVCSAAVGLARAAGVDNVATIEFLVSGAAAGRFAFVEANPRLQVEHTVTEEVTGVDLVQAQLRIAGGGTLVDLGLDRSGVDRPRGTAVQVRVNLETVDPSGRPRPAAGTVTVFEPPGGPGVRVDTHGHAGYTVNPAFDPLLAKIVVHVPAGGLPGALRRARRALAELRVEGVATNAAFLAALLARPEVEVGDVHVRFVEEHLADLVAAAGPPVSAAPPGAAPVEIDDGSTVLAPLPGTVVSIDVAEGLPVLAGQAVLVMEAMKMEHVVTAGVAGTLQRLVVQSGETVAEGAVLAVIEPSGDAGAVAAATETLDVDAIRPDLAEVRARHALTLDDARPDAVTRRHGRGRRTARENLADLCDPGSLVEYAPLVIAAQRRRRSVQDLIERTPADGLVGGLATVNADLFGADAARCAVMSYDYMVLAGTQGQQNHRKKDRLFELAERWRLPVVFFTEGGGGRPGDTDGLGVAGLDCMAFHLFGRLSGLVPLVGIAAGPCFAGNAAILGCCDVVIATEDTSIGMGGPAMIEGGGLGVCRPEEVGPIDVQWANGVVDVRVADEAEATRVAKQYLSYFQGSVAGWTCVDQRLLRSVVPENRVRVYEVRRAIDLLADTGSVLELRRGFAPGMITVLARIEGRPVGIVANDPKHLGGAIDSDAADKAARFLQLCDAHDLPVVFLCDTPGIMVGPDAERSGTVRHASRLFVVGANLTVPFCTIVLRKGYGLGAQAMAGGSFKAPIFTVAWPTGEFGGMGLEGAVKLGYRKELDAVDDPAARQALYEEMVARMYEHGKALNAATHFEIDEVIDPADSRRWIMAALRAAGPPEPRTAKKRPCVDTW